MTKAKIAVSLDRELVRRARRAVADGRAPSVSAYVEAAVAQRAVAETLDELLAELLAQTGGPLTDAERISADRVLGR